MKKMIKFLGVIFLGFFVGAVLTYVVFLLFFGSTPYETAMSYMLAGGVVGSLAFGTIATYRRY